MERVLEWAVMFGPDPFYEYKHLRTLNVAYCHQLTDLSIIEVVRSMPYINELNLAGCGLLTDLALEYISKLCPNLQTICLDAIMGISDEGMVHVASGCLGLKHVSINECRELGDATISFLINFDVDHRLASLSYKGLPRTTEESFSQVPPGISTALPRPSFLYPLVLSQSQPFLQRRPFLTYSFCVTVRNGRF